LPAGASAEAVGFVVVLDDALGEVEGVLEAAGGVVAGGVALGVDVCASALLNASVLTAATAMTCFNMSASWGDVSESNAVAGGHAGVLHGQRPRQISVPGSRRSGATMIAAPQCSDWELGAGIVWAGLPGRLERSPGNHSLSLWPVNNRSDRARRNRRRAWAPVY
jgi:hypothetical protein